MPYQKTQWINNNEPSINAQNLNKIEQGIYDNSVAVETQAGLLDGHTVRSDVPSGAVFTDTTYTAGANVQINGTTISATDTIYDDTALSGRVSTVEGLLDGHSVAKNVPADAVFTDTVYDDTELSGRVTQTESDIEDLQEATEHLSDGDTVYPYASEIEIEDALGVNAKDVKVKITAVQSGSGTPSPQNVRPISGWDECKVERIGKNIWDSNEYYWGYCSSDSNVLRGSATAKSAIIPCKPNTTYTVYKPIGNRFRLCYIKEYPANNVPVYGFVDASGNDTYSITTGDEAKYIVAFVYTAADVEYTYTWEDVQNSLMVVKGSTVPSVYEPYKGKTYIIQLGDTIYGGVIDVTTGVMTVDRASVDLGTLTWSRTSTNNENKKRFVGILADVKPTGSTSTIGNLMCSQFDNVTASDTYACLEGIAAHQTDGKVIAYSEEYSTATSDVFTAAMNGVQLVYELATPFTIQLTPQQIQLLDGYNHLTANTDNIQVTTTDIQGAIGQADELIEANTQAIREINSFDDSIFGTVENGTTASKAYAQGDYFVKDKKMCKALTSIAQGATFTLDTNYAAYTLAEILKAIEQL